jgi:ABC-type nitrate/sulfonate/bicarbonate transport system permease component
MDEYCRRRNDRGNVRVGYLILQAGNYLRTSLVFCGIISIGIMGLLLDGCLRLLLRWADPSRR